MQVYCSCSSHKPGRQLKSPSAVILVSELWAQATVVVVVYIHCHWYQDLSQQVWHENHSQIVLFVHCWNSTINNLWLKMLVFVYIIHGNSIPFWFGDYSCFCSPPRPLCSWSSIDKCAPSFTVASRCFNNREHAQTIHSVRGLLTVFFWRVSLLFYFVHISMTLYTHALWCQPSRSMFLTVHSMVLMAHQVVMASQILQHSFLYVLWGVFFFFSC